MDVREKLVELIESARYWGSGTSEEIADHLIDNGVTVQEWISVDDRLPEEKQRVLVRCKTIGTTVGWRLWGTWMTDLGDGGSEVTHWMPMPQPPKGE